MSSLERLTVRRPAASIVFYLCRGKHFIFNISKITSSLAMPPLLQPRCCILHLKTDIRRPVTIFQKKLFEKTSSFQAWQLLSRSFVNCRLNDRSASRLEIRKTRRKAFLEVKGARRIDVGTFYGDPRNAGGTKWDLNSLSAIV